MIRGVLLIPAEGDPHGLLRDGPCGARPPTATHAEDDCHRLKSPTWADYSGYCGCGVRALVLAWKGAVVPDGVDRATRCQLRTYRDGGPDGQVLRLLRVAGATPGKSLTDLGTLVLLDADGREGA